MVATVQRKEITAGLVTAVLGVILTLPLSIIHPALPFAVALLGYGVVLLLQRNRWLPKHGLTYLIACLATLVMLLPAVAIFKFAEQGLNDGPFYGKAFDGVIVGSAASDRLKYRGGELLIYNRPTDAPVLAYKVGDDVKWAREMDVSQNSRYKNYQHNAMREPSLAYGIFRDRLDFRSRWSFGEESGKAYIWKWGAFHRFYLSW